MKLFRGRTGQTTSIGASVLVALIALFVIFYILFLPPDVRDELLEPGSSGEGAGQQGAESPGEVVPQISTLLVERPGRLDYISPGELEVEHTVPSVNLFSSTKAVLLRRVDTVYVKSNVFNKVSDGFRFPVDDVMNTHNLFITFDAPVKYGMLTIKLNGETISSRRITSEVPEPVILPDELIESENRVEFSVSDVDWRFWSSNEYLLENVKITGELTDISRQQSMSKFTVTEAEKNNLNRAFVKFFPDCVPNQAGVLNVLINGHIIFSGVPDCGILRPISFLPDYLLEGENTLAFTTTEGNYLIDNIQIKTELKQEPYPVYYFDLEDNLFVLTSEQLDVLEGICGEIDGYCPLDCNEDVDIDCCFLTSGKFWCDVPTSRSGSRCEEVNSRNDCSLCPSGYEDSRGYPPVFCTGKCGDDNDGLCPSRCSKNYDLDCCYEDRSRNFWCNDLPVTGVESICEASLSRAECDNCKTGYESFGDVSNLCGAPKVLERQFVEGEQLRGEYDVVLKLQFVDDAELKQAKVFVNGHLLHVDTRDSIYYKSIALYVRPGSNGVEIIPERSLNLVDMQVSLETV